MSIGYVNVCYPVCTNLYQKYQINISDKISIDLKGKSEIFKKDNGIHNAMTKKYIKKTTEVFKTLHRKPQTNLT